MVIVALGLIVLSVIVGILYWLFTIDGPILYSYRDSASASRDPTFIIFNPLRDRNPEIEAERILMQIKIGHCEKAVSNLPFTEIEKMVVCEREAESRLEDWTLRNRRQVANTVSLHYRTKREGFPGFGGEGLIEIEKSSNIWKVTELNFIY